MTILERTLKACGIKPDPKTIKLAQDLVHLNQYVDNLDIISLPIAYLRLLRLYPTISVGHKTPAAISKAFYEEYITKDIDCIDATLGRCIPKTMVEKEFLNPRVDISKIPSEQRDLIDTSTKMYLNPITLQQQSLESDTVVQFKESGEVMTRESFMELVLRNVNQWQGKQNVGFRTPLTKTMIGNPILYAYDEEPKGFFRQRPGTLKIRRIPNKQNYPSSKGVIPSHYFMLTYNHYSFYLPDTVGGRRVLFIMKDAFKKGNLLAFSDDGYVRNGRVHKKTSLHGTQWSYPDDTYLERVTGELMDVGSSLYTYRHSKDPYFQLSGDPYPDEKRFVIDFQ